MKPRIQGVWVAIMAAFALIIGFAVDPATATAAPPVARASAATMGTTPSVSIPFVGVNGVVSGTYYHEPAKIVGGDPIHWGTFVTSGLESPCGQVLLWLGATGDADDISYPAGPVYPVQTRSLGGADYWLNYWRVTLDQCDDDGNIIGNVEVDYGLVGLLKDVVPTGVVFDDTTQQATAPVQDGVDYHAILPNGADIVLAQGYPTGMPCGQPIKFHTVVWDGWFWAGGVATQSHTFPCTSTIQVRSPKDRTLVVVLRGDGVEYQTRPFNLSVKVVGPKATTNKVKVSRQICMPTKVGKGWICTSYLVPVKGTAKTLPVQATYVFPSGTRRSGVVTVTMR